VNICPQKLYIKPPTIVGEKRKVFFNDPDNNCEKCKLCIEICPTDAIIYEENT
jgi:ferredoxin